MSMYLWLYSLAKKLFTDVQSSSALLPPPQKSLEWTHPEASSFQRHHNQFLCPLQRTKVSSEILQVVLHHKDLETWVGEPGMS